MLLCALSGNASGGETSNLQAETLRRIREGKENAAVIAERFSAEAYVAAPGDTIPYRFLPPLDYDPDHRYPLVVCLHGRSGRGRDNVKNIATCWPAQILSQEDMRRRYRSFLLVPQTPEDGSWGYALDDSTMAAWVERSRGGRSMGTSIEEPIIALIQDVMADWSVDPDRVYLTGQSMGGAGTWNLTVNHPEMFAAAMPICGFASAIYGEALTDVAVWAFHGEVDEGIPVQYSRDMVAAIRSASGTARYTEFEGIGHACMSLVFDDPEVLEWLFAQRRGGAR